MLANYLTAKNGKKVALVELDSEKKDFQKICSAYNNLDKNGNIFSKFSLFGVDYYWNINKSNMGELYNYGYDYVIFDMGNDYEENRDELLRCTKKLIVGSMQEWKRADFINLVENTNDETDNSDWIYLLLYAKSKEMKRLRKMYKIDIVQIPWEPDPFLIHSSNFDFFSKIIH